MVASSALAYSATVQPSVFPPLGRASAIWTLRKRPSAMLRVMASPVATAGPSGTTAGVPSAPTAPAADAAAGAAAAAGFLPPELLMKYAAPSNPTATTMAGTRLFLPFLPPDSPAVSSSVFFLAMSRRLLRVEGIQLGQHAPLDPPVLGPVGVGVVRDERPLVGVAGGRDAVGGNALGAGQVAEHRRGPGRRELPVGGEQRRVDRPVVGVPFDRYLVGQGGQRRGHPVQHCGSA